MATLSKEQILAQLNKDSVSAALEDFSLESIDSFGNEESLKQMCRDIGSYNRMLSQRITLINQSLTAAIPFTRENLYLFCALTGSGKSTVAANIAWPLWKQQKKILVISNEETQQDIVFRIACLELGYDFNEWKQGRMSTEMQRECIALFPDITKFVKILDVTWKDGMTTKIEGVQAALEKVANADYSCVLIDYYQLIKDSLRNRERTRYDVLNDLRIYLGQYIKRSNVPVCLFVQLYSLGKKGGVKDLDARIKECSAINEPATVIVEVVPNYEEQTSTFIIHKHRFGVVGVSIVCPFSRGRFLNQVSLKEQAERNLAKLTGKIDAKQSQESDADET